MRFLLIHQSSELYGSDRSFLSAVQGLRECHPDADIVVVLPDRNGPLVALLELEAVEIRLDPHGYLRKVFLRNPFKLFFGLLFSMFKLRRLMQGYDVVYINTVVCVAAILAARSCPSAWVHVRELPTGIGAIVFKLLLKLGREKLIYNSLATQNSFGLSGHVVYNGISTTKEINIANYDYFRDVKLSEQTRFLLIGRISEWKGQAFVLEALAKVSKPLNLVILGGVAPGRGMYAQELRLKADSLPKHSIQFAEFVDDPSEYYRWANFVLVPSLLPEPFGRVAVEAMAYCRPPVVADHGGLSEIVTDDTAGLRFRPGNIDALLKAIETCMQMTSIEYSERVKRCYEVYNERFTEKAYKNKLCGLLK